MSEKQNKNVTVRVQKIKKNHIKQKLIFFLILAIGLVILAIFSEHLCPYDLMHRIWQVHFSPPVFSILWEQIHMGEICCPE
mgnify:FL=1